jgi:hypothetical protein
VKSSNPVKILPTHIKKLFVGLGIMLGFHTASLSQGRVVINEFMAWSGCSTTSEFIELMNFGPGPMNVGCYVVTNGQYSVTIPPNTIIQPGKYFVISGQNILAKDCGNRDSAITVNLNWTTCNCANTTIPTTGDGFMQDGGSANEKIVLLDPSLNVVDAVSRNSPVSSSNSITTPTLSGACTSHTFDLDNMAISYETIGQSTGIDNSYARKVDGDCGWVKTTSISAGAPNKTSSTSSATYNFNSISTSNCDQNTGSISINVNTSSGAVSDLFPMSYILARDIDSNWVYDNIDTYTYGVDNTSPNIDIGALAYGRYRITVASALGCNLKSFDFFIFNCYTVLLPLKLVSYRYAGLQDGQHLFQCQLTGVNNLKTLVLEGSADGNLYRAVTRINETDSLPVNGLLTIKAPVSGYQYYRLRLVDQKDAVSYSPIVSVTGQGILPSFRAWPSPASDKLNIELSSAISSFVTASVYNVQGALVRKERLELRTGFNSFALSVDELPTGIYQVSIPQGSTLQPILLRFVKQ